MGNTVEERRFSAALNASDRALAPEAMHYSLENCLKQKGFSDHLKT